MTILFQHSIPSRLQHEKYSTFKKKRPDKNFKKTHMSLDYNKELDFTDGKIQWIDLKLKLCHRVALITLEILINSGQITTFWFFPAGPQSNKAQ